MFCEELWSAITILATVSGFRLYLLSEGSTTVYLPWMTGVIIQFSAATTICETVAPYGYHHPSLTLGGE